VFDLAVAVAAGGKLTVPENIALLHLPPYSPELNPVEAAATVNPQSAYAISMRCIFEPLQDE
jgi:transposase